VKKEPQTEYILSDGWSEMNMKQEYIKIILNRIMMKNDKLCHHIKRFINMIKTTENVDEYILSVCDKILISDINEPNDDFVKCVDKISTVTSALYYNNMRPVNELFNDTYVTFKNKLEQNKETICEYIKYILLRNIKNSINNTKYRPNVEDFKNFITNL
jgi:hypothetical protein